MRDPFTLHTDDTAPADAKPLFEKSKAAFGMVPNLHAVMAEQPLLLDAYQQLWGMIGERSGFSPAEQQTVYQASNVFNRCHYCVPAHATLCKMQGLDDELTETLAKGQTPSDPKLAALHAFTVRCLETQGHAEQADLDAFFAAGYEAEHALSVVTILACKVLSNYTNALAQTPLDQPFQAMAEKLGVAATA